MSNWIRSQVRAVDIRNSQLGLATGGCASYGEAAQQDVGDNPRNPRHLSVT